MKFTLGFTSTTSNDGVFIVIERRGFETTKNRSNHYQAHNVS